MNTSSTGPRKSSRFSVRLYQYYRLSSSFLYAALLARWTILLPLVGSKFLPGGIHQFLCYLLIFTSTFDLFWNAKFHGIKSLFRSRTTLKDLNFFYFVAVMHFHDDYEHAPVLKNTSYSCFIIGLAFTQMYYHWCKLFKASSRPKRSVWWRMDSFLMMPLLYSSEFYLLMLNLQMPNYHLSTQLETLNKVLLVLFIPVSLHAFKKQISLL
ncbi:LAFE_0F17370g1_1 [Lachancea fermentati]|uniref:LAFE_0F17370g1_1 n=1 Tax=Lachancea fermentati TaxID=4955 RepID=A0A1G4MGG8_LACFM|nr:LAFE_0F17370g1_1 [Lachancea fermentati]